MRNKKPPRWSVRFELAPENEDHVKLHDYLERLAENESAADWMRSTLLAALPDIPRPTAPTPKQLPVVKGRLGRPVKVERPAFEDDVHYEDVEE